MRRAKEKDIKNWINGGNTALLVTGARQTGKTYLIRQCLKESDTNFIELNFIDHPEFVEIFSNAHGAEDILTRLSVRFGRRMVPEKTVIFLDEVQECKDIVTEIKFLVEDGRYRYILSGSLLGVELNDIRSVPVGYMDIVDLYPMDISEYFTAIGISDDILSMIQDSFENWKPVDDFVHKQLISAFYMYLITGGMPQALDTYLKTQNLADVLRVQKAIIRLYRQDFAKYEGQSRNKLQLNEVYDVIPSELSEKNKRFELNSLGDGMSYDRAKNAFLWLKDAGVALPVYNVTEPTIPLAISTKRNLFKLFLSDVGLLTAQYSTETRIKILNHDPAINNGGLFENVAAQELVSHGYDVRYFNRKKQGELDLVIEQGDVVLPIEIKSGKDYKRHSALTNVLLDENYHIPEAFVFSNANVSKNGKVTYLPIYMLSCVRKTAMKSPVVRLDLTGLK